MTSRQKSSDSTQPPHVLPDNAWKRLRHNGQLVRDDVVGDLPPALQVATWQQFKQIPMARRACLLLSLLEPQPEVNSGGLYRRNHRRPPGPGLFEDIALLAHRDRAKEIYARLCQRHSERLAFCKWLRPVLVGRARWLATHPDAHGSAWGHQMRRKKAGKHTQQRFRTEKWHPLPSVRKAWGLPEPSSHPSDVPKV